MASEFEDEPPRKKGRVQQETSEHCPYLAEINRKLLDFDFEKLCSVSLSNLNVYGCLCCGKYFQGAPRAPALFRIFPVLFHRTISAVTDEIFNFNCVFTSYGSISHSIFEFCGVSAARSHVSAQILETCLCAPTGRGKQSHAYIHSVQQDHHVFINLETGKVRRAANDCRIELIRPAFFCVFCFLDLSSARLWSSVTSSRRRHIQCFLQHETCRFIACPMDTRSSTRLSRTFR